MIEKTNNPIGAGLRYESPEIGTVPVDARSVLCQSYSEPMCEKDYGDGGFH